MHTTTRRVWFSLALLAACSSPWAQTTLTATKGVVPPSVAIYSQVAREVIVTTPTGRADTNLARTHVQRIAIPQGALDQVLVIHAGQAVKKLLPMSRTWLVAPTDEDLFDSLQNATAGVRVAVPADMAQALKEQGSTHVLLFSRFRAETKIPMQNGTTGVGTLNGMGYYVDASAVVVDLGGRGGEETKNQAAPGFLAPHAYFRVSLIDVATMTVIRTRTTTAAQALPATRSPTGNVWDVLSPQDKVKRLAELGQAELDRLLPDVLAQPW